MIPANEQKKLADVLTTKAFWLIHHAQSKADLDNGLALLEKAITACPSCARAHSEKGNLLGKLRQFDRAIEAASRAVELQPTVAKYHGNLAAIQLDALGHEVDIRKVRERSTGLLADFARIIRDFPNYPSAYIGMAELLAMCGSPQSEWESCLASAGDAYFRTRRMSSGLPATEQAVSAALAEVTQKCYAAARKWPNIGTDTFEIEDGLYP